MKVFVIGNEKNNTIRCKTKLAEIWECTKREVIDAATPVLPLLGEEWW